jgi:phosphate transport system substrate-binding protein
MLRIFMASIIAAVLSVPLSAEARTSIEVVGSSTVFPFTARVIDRFVKTTQFSVVNRSTGTGGGITAFCAGLGDQHPDITAASRPMTAAERNRCAANSVTEITEIKIGSDGIVFANNTRSPRLNVTRRHLFDALARQVVKGGVLVDNPYRTWQDIDPAFPAKPIVVLGPPTTSGTRDAFVELAMIPGCDSYEVISALPADRKKTVCTNMRDGGYYVDMGENDVEIVKRLQVEPDAFGIFGFSYAFENRGIIAANAVEGIEPSEEAIADGSYPLSRPLFLYVKDLNVSVAPGLKEFLLEYTSERAMGPNGYLVDAGLVPLLDAERLRARQAAAGLGRGTLGR